MRALITGASSGIGAAFAARLARDGCDLHLVARRPEPLEALARRLHERHGIAAEVVMADLTEPQALGRVEARVAEDAALELVVNCAGVAILGRFAALDAGGQEAAVRLNVVALTRLTRAALPGMIGRRRGAIINVSSIAGFVPARFSATYAASKAYVNSFTEALHEELRGTGVRVQLLCPGFTRTPFIERSEVRTERFPAFAWMAPEEVVDASLAALRRGRLLCVPGRANRLLVATLAVCPRRLARRLVGVGAKRSWAAVRIRTR
jgi:hypothetical protein